MKTTKNKFIEANYCSLENLCSQSSYKWNTTVKQTGSKLLLNFSIVVFLEARSTITALEWFCGLVF